MSLEDQRASALKSKHVEPLGGTPVQQPPHKQGRVEQELADPSGSAPSRVPGSPYPAAPLGDEVSGATPPGLAETVPEQDSGIILPFPGTAPIDPMTQVNDMFSKIMSNMADVKTSVVEVKASVATVKEDISQVRSSMVNRKEFDSFKSDVDSRFVALSEVSSNSVEVQGSKTAIQRQVQALGRLDVGHKSICFSNFPLDMSASARMAEIEKFMLLKFPSVPLVKIESVFSGKPGAQHITKNTILEVPSQQIRNKLLSDVAGQDIHFTCLTQAITISRAKTQQQRDRNTVVLKAVNKI